jgi:hypothetical protein
MINMRKNRTKKTEEDDKSVPEELKEDSNENNPEVIQEENSTNYNKIVAGQIYNFSITIYKFFIKTLLVILKSSGIYLLWICLHYFSAHLYIKFCVPDTIVGFLMSPFMISTPHCQGLRWIVYNSTGVINNMWILIGAWIYSIIWICNKDNHVEPTSL